MLMYKLVYLQYLLQGHRQDINTMIEEAILDADSKGVTVLSLGLFNQASFSLFFGLVILFIPCVNKNYIYNMLTNKMLYVN